jgi:RNA polymerase sigma-54 factor
LEGSSPYPKSVWATEATPTVGAYLRAGVETKLLPGVLQTLALLPLAHNEVEAAVDAALRENPMLERSSGRSCPGCGRHIQTARCPVCAGARSAAVEAAVSPFETLHVLAGCEVRADCRRALSLVLDHLTDRGLLDADVEEIAALHGLKSPDVAESIRAIKAAGPPGIAERSVRDSLAVQAQELVQRGAAPAWMVMLVRENLDLIARDDVAEAARLFGQDSASVKEAFAIVRRELCPRVGLFLTEDRTPWGSPDVYVSRDESGALLVETIDSRWFGLRIAETPPEIRADREARQWLQKHEHSARMLLTQLDARASVLKQVAVAAVRRQRDFLDRGPAGHIQLTRSDIARELGLHPSTVARAVRGKVVRTPTGLFIEFKELFGSGVAVRAEIAALLRGSASSDAQLCIALRARGYTIARRTVAKYRAQLGIAAARRS